MGGKPEGLSIKLYICGKEFRKPEQYLFPIHHHINTTLNKVFGITLNYISSIYLWNIFYVGKVILTIFSGQNYCDTEWTQFMTLTTWMAWVKVLITCCATFGLAATLFTNCNCSIIENNKNWWLKRLENESLRQQKIYIYDNQWAWKYNKLVI